MADRITAQQLVDFSELNLRQAVTRTLTINNDSISLADITAYVDSWGTIKTSIYNKHPVDRGNFDFPVTTIGVDNSGGVFDMGGIIFPGGTDDFASTVAVLTIEIAGTTFLSFTGAVLEPEIDPSGSFDIVIEHPLTNLTRRKWIREDRIGGDTGVDFFFNS